MNRMHNFVMWFYMILLNVKGEYRKLDDDVIV